MGITIYGIRETLYDDVVYVGQTSRSAEWRLAEAKSRTRPDSPYSAWAHNHPTAIAEVLDVVATPRDARIAEAYWIHRLNPRLNVERYQWHERIGSIDDLYRSIHAICCGAPDLGDLTSPRESGVDEHQDSSGNSPARKLSSGACETANLGGKL